MKKPKIIFTVINDLNYDQRMIRICKSLVTNGYEILLVGRKLKKSQPIQSQPFQQKRLRCFFEKGKLFYLEYNLRLLFFLWRKKWDGVCAIDLDTILPAYYISKWRRKKMIYDAHEFFTEVPEVIQRPKVKRIWEWVGRKTIPTCTHCYTVGDSLAKELEKKYQTRFDVIRNVPEKTNFESGKSENQKNDKPIIFYQGALNEGRGLEEMLEAMTLLTDVEFWLAGEGDLSDFLRKKTRQLQIENKVKFMGYQFPEQLKKITPQVTIGINFLKNESLNYYYSLANKAFDYVNAEVPAIHMNFPEYQNLMKEYEVGLLIENLNKEAIAKSVNRLLQNKPLYQKLKSNCAQAKLVWTWENEEKRLLKFYDNIFKTNKSRG